MTQLLIRLFVRHPDDTKNAAVRTAYGNLASLVGMACNLLLCLGKLAAGTLFGSIAIMADALNNLSDASSNVVSLVGFRLAAKGPDEKHPYGHARYEYLAGLVVCVTILAIGLSLLKESVLKVLHPTAVVCSWLSVGVLAASIGVKLWMSRFNKTIGQRITSETLMATAAASRNDVLTTSAVLLSTVLSHLTCWDVLDGLMGVAVAAVIFGGVNSIARVCEWLVPIMAGAYALGCLVIKGMNAPELGEAVGLILERAFTPKAAFGGAVGSGPIMALQLGCARGLFSNESGLGTAPIVAAAAKTKHPADQALISMTGAFWSTGVICLLTGLVLVSTMIVHPEIGEDILANPSIFTGAALASAAFAEIPVFGTPVLVLGMCAFAYSTILGWSYYGNRCVA